jgi:hypothetical protein
MFYTAETLGQLKEAVDSLIEQVGIDTPVGCELNFDGVPALDEYLMLEWVIIDKHSGNIEGREADDDEMNLKPNQINAIRIT